MTLHRDDARRGRRRRRRPPPAARTGVARRSGSPRAPRAPASIIRSRSPRRFGSAWSSPGRSRGRGPTSSARSRRRRSRAATRMPPTTLCRARTARGGSRCTRARSPREGRAARGGRPRGARGRPRGMARGSLAANPRLDFYPRRRPPGDRTVPRPTRRSPRVRPTTTRERSPPPRTRTLERRRIPEDPPRTRRSPRRDDDRFSRRRRRRGFLPSPPELRGRVRTARAFPRLSARGRRARSRA